MHTTTITVSGMTCEHCERAVKEELSALDGVRSVDVDLVAGGDSTVRIASDAELSAVAIEAAVDEAGYEVR
ncbi:MULTISPECIES: heavy-metal-associated domain-containing protein [Brevibacterium]|uniref:Heavy metal transporter n=1 Tax=Brevibacterium luteolum TaxID=199591 RepID=A0A2N6PG94_9MICO|nr:MULTISPECIES: heavy metal-associated domain-containing protein [Brevibacterium]MCT1656012.1 heavy-metal-associated domain-containing protein [Brevibacterium luteolum]MCT1690857.1 heavy-metal-associated domain-containing protein [Brevibacterium sp. p3-SID960]MCT1872436.1 heavy-metal-associated domain-containing protein [Brevibacterium luteolum]MCT1890176.1 heavy-metal-associated domain-containing protein [Brevibacterium luteolum]MCT1892696.1 heavy-metal-associated domain-containing protein [